MKVNIWLDMSESTYFNKSIILPSENQTREFDAKLLLAAVLAEYGFDVLVGARHQIHNAIGDFPKSIYVAKDFRRPSERILSIIEGLGHRIVAWDEEGFVPPSPEIYYERRYSLSAISRVKDVFAWGPANERLMLNAPAWPAIPIHRTGNPRLDLLRLELRAFHQPSVSRIKQTYGRFILFNSNFAAFNPAIKTVVPLMSERSQKPSTFIGARRKLFSLWQDLIPKLARAISPIRVIIRPHPVEDHQLWKNLALDFPNLHVEHDGSAVPWILAAETMVHSGCTTGVESYFMNKPAISFRPRGLLPLPIGLPDALSVVAESENELLTLVKSVLNGTPLPNTDAQRFISQEAAFSLTGQLAADQIARVLTILATDPQSFGRRRTLSLLESQVRSLQKGFTALFPGHKTSVPMNKLRYPGLSLAEVEEKINLFQKSLRRFDAIVVKSVKEQVFRVSRKQ